MNPSERVLELLAEAQHRLWNAMYYVRNFETGISEMRLKQAIQSIEKMQARLHTEECSPPAHDGDV